MVEAPISPDFEWKKQIRCLALAIIRNKRGEILVHFARDPVKNENFFRPLGGGIEYGETASHAVVREFEEELGYKIRVTAAPRVFENLFTYRGRPGHEIVFLFEAEFEDPNAYDHREMDIIEKGVPSGKAIWISKSDVDREEGRLYPNGIVELVFKTEANE